MSVKQRGRAMSQHAKLKLRRTRAWRRYWDAVQKERKARQTAQDLWDAWREARQKLNEFEFRNSGKTKR